MRSGLRVIVMAGAFCGAVLLSGCPNPVGGGEIAGSATEEETTQPPAVPTGLGVVAGFDQVTLSWTGDSTVNESYGIQRRAEGESAWDDLQIDPPLGPALTGYIDTTVTPQITYRYRIRAVNSVGPASADEGWVEFDPVTTARLAAPTLSPPQDFLPGGKIGLSTNRPSEVRYYFTTNGTDPTFTNPVFDPSVDDSGPDTTAVWQFEGIVLSSAGDYELRVLVRSEGWLDSPVTTQTVTVVPRWTESNGTWVLSPGISWNDFVDLVDATSDGDTITWSGNATISLPGTTTGTSLLRLAHGVTFDAGGHAVVIDGITLTTGSDYWIGFWQPAPGAVVRFEGLTLRNFHSRIRGGFIRVPPDVTVEFRDVRLENNLAGATGQGSLSSAGGAIANEGGTVLVEDSVFLGNRGAGGGAIANFSGSTTVRRSRFLGNSVFQPNTGGIPDYRSGGAILAINGTVNLIDSYVAGNQSSVPGSPRIGGAMSALDGTISVQGSQFAGNAADSGVVADAGENGTIRISSSAFYDNRSTVFSPTVLDSVVNADRNPAGLELRSSTFVDNTVLSLGGFVDEVTGHNLLVVNTPTGLGDFATSHVRQDVNAADIFVALPDEGPDGVWGTDDDAAGDFRLRDDADPALRAAVIDGGEGTQIATDFADADEDGDLAEDEPFDLAGNARVQGATIDVGAVEH